MKSRHFFSWSVGPNDLSLSPSIFAHGGRGPRKTLQEYPSALLLMKTWSDQFKFHLSVISTVISFAHENQTCCSLKKTCILLASHMFLNQTKFTLLSSLKSLSQNLVWEVDLQSVPWSYSSTSENLQTRRRRRFTVDRPQTTSWEPRMSVWKDGPGRTLEDSGPTHFDLKRVNLKLYLVPWKMTKDYVDSSS